MTAITLLSARLAIVRATSKYAATSVPPTTKKLWTSGMHFSISSLIFSRKITLSLVTDLRTPAITGQITPDSLNPTFTTQAVNATLSNIPTLSNPTANQLVAQTLSAAGKQ